MTDPFALAESLGVERVFLWNDPGSGLRAICVVDDLTLGPAVGGVRTRAYPDFESALAEVAGLARTMTLKCSISGLDAGGAKTVVLAHDGLDRARAFSVLGDRIDELGGIYHAAGDLGTSAEDVNTMAQRSQWVHANEDDLTGAVAHGLLRCMEACAGLRGHEGLAGMTVAVQGCGAIGAAAVRRLVTAGADVVVADVDSGRAEALGEELGVRITSPAEILLEDVDVISPCAIGGVITADLVGRLRGRAICGAANNILADEAAAAALVQRDIPFVPDFIASAGAVVEGIGHRVMGLTDRTPLLDGLGDTARQVLHEARERGETSLAVARRMARERVAAARARASIPR